MEDAFRTLRGLIIRIAVSFPATIFLSVGWSQSQPNRKRTTYYSELLSADTYYDTSSPDYYYEGIKKSVELLKSETERSAIGQILAELDKKSNREILSLKLAPDVPRDCLPRLTRHGASLC